MNRWSTVGLQDNHTTLHNATMVDACQDTFVQIHGLGLGFATPRVNPKRNCGLWVTMMYPCGLVSCNKCTTLGGVGNGEGYACEGAGVVWKIPVPFSQFCCESKAALKDKAYKKFNLQKRL